MPNWVKTIVKTKPETLKDILEQYSEKGVFSFNKVIPMPKELSIESGSRGEEGLMFLFLDSKDDLFKMKINRVYRELNFFHNDIFNDSRFRNIENKMEEYRSNPDFIESIELGKKYISNFDKYGHSNWYNWCYANWGTKWDIDSFQKNDNTMIFETANGFVGNVILELSKNYPDSTFECKFADEGIIENSGILTIQNGETFKQHYGLSEKEIEDIWNTYFDDSGQEIICENEDYELEMD